MDLGIPDVPLTDTSTTSAEINALITELLGLQGVSDVLREFQRLGQAVTAAASEERRALERNEKIVSEIVTVQQARRECEATIVDVFSHKDVLLSDVKRVTRELFDVNSRVFAESERRDGLEASIVRNTAVIEAGAGWKPEQTARLRELQATRASAQVDLDAKRATVTILRRDVDVLGQAVDRGEATKSELLTSIATVQADTQAAVAKAQRLAVAQTKQASELKDLQTEVEGRQRRLVEAEDAITEGKKDVARADAILKARKALMDKSLQEYNAVHARTVGLTDELDAALVANENLVRELRSIDERTVAYRKEEGILLEEAARASALTALANKKLADATTAMQAVEQEQAALSAEAAALRASAEKISLQNDVLERSVRDLQKEREILRQSLEALAGKGVDVDTVIGVQHSTQKMTENELITVRKSVKEHRERIEDLHDEIARLDDALEQANRSLLAVQEQVTLQGVQERALQKKTVLLTGKLKQQQAMYESAREERNAYSKSMMDVEAEISRVSREFKDMAKAIDMHKDDITLKDQEVVREHFSHHKVEKEKESIRSETLRVKRQINSSEEILGAQAIESAKLVDVIGRGDEERDKQSKEFLSVIAERDALRAQVVQRDAELTALYEKLKIQRSTIDKGAATFRGRKADEAQLMADVRAAQTELQFAKLQVCNADKLKHAIVQLEKEIRAEQIKSTFLESESSRPMNVHRWRQLESSNPTLHAAIFKVQSLQKRLIQVSAEIAQRDEHTAEKEKLFKDLRAILDRQPGMEVVEQLTVLQQTLKQKHQQLRSMEAELAACKSYVADDKYELEQLAQQTEKLERAYLARAARAERVE